jgi:hypothetical protein
MTAAKRRMTPAWYLALAAGVALGFLLAEARRWRGEARAEQPAKEQPPAAAPWLTGSDREKFTQIEKHLRGLDVAMAEITYRYGELIIAGRARNWDYAKYQAEKIELALRLAVERRPKRAKSAKPFLDTDLPKVFDAVKAKDGGKLDKAITALHDACVQCHKAEEVLYFKEAVDRTRDRALAAAKAGGSGR